MKITSNALSHIIESSVVYALVLHSSDKPGELSCIGCAMMKHHTQHINGILTKIVARISTFYSLILLSYKKHCHFYYYYYILCTINVPGNPGSPSFPEGPGRPADPVRPGSPRSPFGPSLTGCGGAGCPRSPLAPFRPDRPAQRASTTHVSHANKHYLRQSNLYNHTIGLSGYFTRLYK